MIKNIFLIKEKEDKWKHESYLSIENIESLQGLENFSFELYESPEEFLVSVLRWFEQWF